MSILVYLSDGVIKSEGYVKLFSEKGCSIFDIPVEYIQGFWQCKLSDQIDKLPTQIDEFVIKVSMQTHIPSEPYREHGIYRLKSAIAEVDISGPNSNRVLLEANHSDGCLDDMRELLYMIKTGRLIPHPEDSYEREQVKDQPLELVGYKPTMWEHMRSWMEYDFWFGLANFGRKNKIILPKNRPAGHFKKGDEVYVLVYENGTKWKKEFAKEISEGSVLTDAGKVFPAGSVFTDTEMVYSLEGAGIWKVNEMSRVILPLSAISTSAGTSDRWWERFIQVAIFTYRSLGKMIVDEEK